ncbi:VRR-NUC domain-containing protein [Acidiphilium sp.]|uniref:VRR-NUC domain-containing protein n=1 Tax=Acidiphilium sp. TaxID=527 RepID=UPI00338F982A
MRRHDEDDEQRALFAWSRLQEAAQRDLAMLMAVPNGGARNARESARMKSQGVSRGFPDVFLFAARGKYHGLAIELKRSDGRRHDIADAQYAWIGGLRQRGYLATVAYGWSEARDIINEYLACCREP